MPDEPVPRAADDRVRCVACRTAYALPDRRTPLAAPGCPACGSPSWISESLRPPPRAEAQVSPQIGVS